MAAQKYRCPPARTVPGRRLCGHPPHMGVTGRSRPCLLALGAPAPLCCGLPLGRLPGGPSRQGRTGLPLGWGSQSCCPCGSWRSCLRRGPRHRPAGGTHDPVPTSRPKPGSDSFLFTPTRGSAFVVCLSGLARGAGKRHVSEGEADPFLRPGMEPQPRPVPDRNPASPLGARDGGTTEPRARPRAFLLRCPQQDTVLHARPGVPVRWGVRGTVQGSPSSPRGSPRRENRSRRGGLGGGLQTRGQTPG